MTSNKSKRRRLYFVNPSSEKSEAYLNIRYSTADRYHEEISKSIDNAIYLPSRALSNMPENVNWTGYKHDRFNCLAAKDKLK